MIIRIPFCTGVGGAAAAETMRVDGAGRFLNLQRTTAVEAMRKGQPKAKEEEEEEKTLAKHPRSTPYVSVHSRLVSVCVCVS